MYIKSTHVYKKDIIKYKDYCHKLSESNSLFCVHKKFTKIISTHS